LLPRYCLDGLISNDAGEACFRLIVGLGQYRYGLDRPGRQRFEVLGEAGKLRRKVQKIRIRSLCRDF
jgi:hypothetical protein